MRTLTRYDIDDLLREAKKSPRKRAILRLHKHPDPVQRMLNAMLPGTYIPPHKHEAPDKVELFSILRGRVAVLQFDARGEIEERVFLEASGDTRIVDIPPRTYHSIIAYEPSVLLEIIQGPYDKETHKRLASWAPDEDNPKAGDYLMYLTSVIHNWR
ncbi:MAG: WbuC family cupin fold metalloprotein [Aggregatilineales bacterium]